MFQALILVRNIESVAADLDFGEFTIRRVGIRFNSLRQSFSSTDVNQDDWLLQKPYPILPPGPPGSPVGDIPKDVEDVLLLLRLFKCGDISFIKQAIIQPSGGAIVQFPYRAMNDLNSYSGSRFEVAQEECYRWKPFAEKIRQSQSWKSGWFSTVRRFFLSGGAKEFNPPNGDADRIADYATALEAALVPESAYITRRLSNRAGALLEQDAKGEKAAIVRFIKRLYGIRSCIVHGSLLDEKAQDWLLNNWNEIEIRMREIIAAAVMKLPPRAEDRRRALSALYDLTDENHGQSAFQKFKEIKSVSVRRATASKIADFAAR